MYQQQMINNIMTWERRLDIEKEEKKNRQSESYLAFEVTAKPQEDNRFERAPRQTTPVMVPQPVYFWFPQAKYHDSQVS